MTIQIRYERGAARLSLVSRRQVQQRIELMLARFADKIAKLVVVLSDEADAGGHPSRTRCEVEIRLRPPLPIRVQDTDADALAAATRAADRAARALARALGPGLRGR